MYNQINFNIQIWKKTTLFKYSEWRGSSRGSKRLRSVAVLSPLLFPPKRLLLMSPKLWLIRWARLPILRTKIIGKLLSKHKCQQEKDSNSIKGHPIMALLFYVAESWKKAQLHKKNSYVISSHSSQWIYQFIPVPLDLKLKNSKKNYWFLNRLLVLLSLMVKVHSMQLYKEMLERSSTDSLFNCLRSIIRGVSLLFVLLVWESKKDTTIWGRSVRWQSIVSLLTTNAMSMVWS